MYKIEDIKNKTIQGNVEKVLKLIPDKCINTCVSSPPYWNLRNYNDEPEQIGNEKTPEEYIQRLVGVFSEVYRTLMDDGTVWLNIGDTYNSAASNQNGRKDKKSTINNVGYYSNGDNGLGRRTILDSIKKKELIGIPFLLADELRKPRYTGTIKKEIDRVWLAAMIDGEGCICGTHHIRKDDNSDRTSVFINVTNTNKDLLDNLLRIYPDASNVIHQKNGENHFGNKDVFRWNVFNIQNKKQLIEEIYPYLIAKKRQALVAYNFLLLQEKAKHYGKTPQKDKVKDKRKYLIETLSDLNKDKNVDLPSWLIEPENLYKPMFYLRQDIIWLKRNAMPESVKDRCTKAHEYIFLLSKSEKYYFDYESIMEEAAYDGRKDTRMKGSHKYSKPGITGLAPQTMAARGSERWTLKNGKYMRNKRSVWDVPTKPFKGAHFAVFPEELIKDCIIAGCPEDGIVLDPFFGSGTTGIVSRKLNRNFVGIELSSPYIKISDNRLIDELGIFL